MKDISNQSRSLWMEEKLPDFPKLQQNMDCDICIVGAGIAGLTCAYTLARAGKSVVVIDRSGICSGETLRTTAHLTWALDSRYYKLLKLFGENATRLIAESHSRAIDYIEKIIRDENIDCDFSRLDAYLFLTAGTSPSILDNELVAVKQIGQQVSKLTKCPLCAFEQREALQFPNQAQFHVSKYIKGLIQAIEKNGVKIFTHSPVISFKDGDPCQIKTEAGFLVNAKSVIVTTGTPVNDRLFIHTKQAPYRTYVIAASIPINEVSQGLYWDTEDPYHYVRLQKNDDNEALAWLIIGGEDHKTGQDPENELLFPQLEEWAKIRFPKLGEIKYRWSGQVFEPVDLIGFIGKNPSDKNTYVATGFSGNGITHATIAGLLLPDLILGNENPWKDIYDPSRKSLSTLSDFVEENFNSVMQYLDWFTPGEIENIQNLAPNEGIILREGIKKIAVYKDEGSEIHLNSAFCPHLGGCVRWNKVEKSWDCPCHGSRFDGCGNVLSGPSSSNLEPYKKK